MSRAVVAVAMAALVVLAGCAGAGTLTEQSVGQSATATGATTSSQGSVNFYISDEKNAIGQFEHLNVTITAVGFRKANPDTGDEGGEESGSTEKESAENESAENETDSTENETAADEPTENESADETSVEEKAGANNEVADKQKSDEWVVKQVDSRTVDLTELQGANATSLGTFGVEAGTYEKVFVYVSDVNATLKTGEQVNVKLPSQKIQLNKRFTVGPNQTADFVFDITVFEAGKSGKYILKPVVSESGTDVPIEDVDEKEKGDEKGEKGDEQAALNAAFVSNVTAGENATVEVTRNGSAVANATVSVDGKAVGQTGADGRLTFIVPVDAEELEVEIRGPDGGEAELKHSLTASDSETEETSEQKDGEGQAGGSDGTDGLTVSLAGNVTAGSDATISVTKQGEAVKNAKVFVDGELVGRTGEDGTVTVTVPDADEFTLTVQKDGSTVTRTVTVGSA